MALNSETPDDEAGALIVANDDGEDESNMVFGCSNEPDFWFEFPHELMTERFMIIADD